MPFEISLSRPANALLERLPTSFRDEIKEGLKVLQENPDRKRAKADIGKLMNVGDCWRLRIGDYRIFFRSETNAAQVFVDMIVHKQQAEKEIARLLKKTKRKKMEIRLKKIAEVIRFDGNGRIAKIVKTIRRACRGRPVDRFRIAPTNLKAKVSPKHGAGFFLQ